MSRFMNERMRDLAPYEPGEQPQTDELIKLNSNENPYPPSPVVKQAVAMIDQDNMRLYPDPDTGLVIRSLAAYYGLREDQIAMGNGSDEILAFAYMAYGGRVYFPETSYGFYPVFGTLFDCEAHPVRMDDDMRIKPEQYRANDGLVVIANPNAPTGMALTRAEVEEILRANPDQVVVIDEAYVDFGAESCVPLADSYENLLIVQTFSKSRSLAGMRIGFAIGDSALIDDINRVKFSFNPYNLSQEAIIAAKAAIDDDEYFQLQRQRVIRTREAFCRELDRMGVFYYPSQANFVFAKTGSGVYEALRERGILVRHWETPKIRDFIRVTIGRDEDMKKLTAALEEILGARRQGAE
ncbi:MAG: histidinol-phosphate transaminase [Anaerovoracaceae bacterium]|jgi:histidinol-phosphate aminotransferase